MRRNSDKRKKSGLVIHSTKRRRLSKQPIVLAEETLSPTAAQVYRDSSIRVTPTAHGTPNGKTTTTQQGTPLTPTGITGILRVRSPLSSGMPTRRLFQDSDLDEIAQVTIQRQWCLSGVELKSIIPYFGYPDGRVPRLSQQPAAAFQDKKNNKKHLSADEAAKQIYQHESVCRHEWNHIIAHRFCGYLSQVIIYKITDAIAHGSTLNTALIARIFNAHFITVAGLNLSSEQPDLIDWVLTQFTEQHTTPTRKSTVSPNEASDHEKGMVQALTLLLSMSRHNIFLATTHCNTVTCAYEDEINKKLDADHTVIIHHSIRLDPTNYNQPHSDLFYSICVAADASQPGHAYTGRIDPHLQKAPSFEITKMCDIQAKLAARQDKPGNLLTQRGIGLFADVDYDPPAEELTTHSPLSPSPKKIRRN